MAALQYLLESPFLWILSFTQRALMGFRRYRAMRSAAKERRFGLNG